MKEPQPLTPGRTVIQGIYGLPGAGKTRLAGSSAYKTLIIRPPTDHTDSIGEKDNIEEVVISDWSEQLEHFQWGQQGGYKQYTWVWLDGVTLFEEIGMDDVFGHVVMQKPHRAENGPDKGEYGVNRQRLGKWLRDMIGLSKEGHFNFGFTAHVMEYVDPVESETIWIPQVGDRDGKFAMKLCGYTNICAYLKASDEDKKPRKETLLVDGEGFIGKDQYNCFPKLKSGRHGFINPTLTDIEDAIASKKRPRSRPVAAKKRRTTRKKK